MKWLGVFLAMLLGSAGSARATFIQSSVGLQGARTITFDEHIFPSGTPISIQYSDLGVTFGPTLYYSPLLTVGVAHVDQTNLSNFAGPGQPAVNPFVIAFTQPHTAADFAMATLDSGVSSFTALLGGVPVDFGTALTSLDSRQNFYGFTGVTFDTIEVSAGGLSGIAVLDNLQIGGATPVPEPPSSLLLGLGAIGLAITGSGARKSMRPKTPAKGSER
jgi:hypothetical protein